MFEEIADLMDQLRKMVRAQKIHNLLPPEDDNILSALYWLIEEYDRNVSEQVFRALQGEIDIEVIEKSNIVESSFEDFSKLGADSNFRLLKKYLDYYKNLKDTANILSRLSELYRLQNSHLGQLNH